MVPLGVSRPSGSVTGGVAGAVAVFGSPGSCPTAVAEIAAHNRSQYVGLKKKDIVPSPEEGRGLLIDLRSR